MLIPRPTSHSVFTANDGEMKLLGSLFINIEYNGHTAKQLCYVSDQLKGFFLSTRACIQLGIIPKMFPENITNKLAVTVSNEEINDRMVTAACGCPTRTPPPVPPVLPMPAYEEIASSCKNGF